MLTRYATTEQSRRRRRGKRDRLALASLPAVQTQQPTAKNADPDHALICYQAPQSKQRISRRELLQCDHAAYPSIDASEHAERRQYAGVSSAAACIVLELPSTTRQSRSGSGTSKQPTIELLSSNRKRRTPVPDREMTRWRISSGSKACYRFKPVYTHQFFTDEQIQGYRPTDGAIEESLSVSGAVSNENHPSFSHHATVSHTLSIQVRLAPSCRKCCLILEVGKAGQQLKNEVNSGKRSPFVGRRAKKLRRGTTTTGEVASILRQVSLGSFSDGGDGDDEDDCEEFELNDKQGGRRKRMRCREGSHKECCLQKLPSTGGSIRRSRREHGKGDERMSTIDESEELPPLNRRRKRDKQMQLEQSEPRQVTDVSDNPSSDEEVESPRSGPSSITTAYHDPGKIKMGTIITQVSAGLPEVVAILLKDVSAVDGDSCFRVMSSSVDSIADIECDYLDEPMGTVIHEYSREKKNMNLCGSGGIPSPSAKGSSRNASKGNFVLSLADMRTDSDAREYHDEVEKISQWFIEIASCVEVGMSRGIESDGGYWKVLYLFEKHGRGAATKYSLVGYVTLFYHRLHMTVCQAVCLPLYQRSGHGTEMLRAAYGVCEARQILVESPAPAFVALRNRLDYSLVRSLIARGQIFQRKFTEPQQFLGVNDAPLPDDVLVKVGSELHITPQQVQTAYAIWVLGEMENSILNTVNSSVSAGIADQTISSMEAAYKLMVKRSLLRTLRGSQDELNFNVMGMEKQREHLENCFNTAVFRYRSVPNWL